jgi:hypothetical protein
MRQQPAQAPAEENGLARLLQDRANQMQQNQPQPVQ